MGKLKKRNKQFTVIQELHHIEKHGTLQQIPQKKEYPFQKPQFLHDELIEEIGAICNEGPKQEQEHATCFKTKKCAQE